MFAVHAHGWFGRFMHARGWRGFTLPLPFLTIVFFWLTRDEFPEARVVVHEAAHAIQIEEHGPLPFIVRYLTDLVRFGYWALPYERAARAAEETVTELDASALRVHVD